jgi:hypothetical protein
LNNRIRQAFDRITPQDIGNHRIQPQADAAAFYIQFLRDPMKADLLYRVEGSSDLQGASTGIYNSRMDNQGNNQGERMRIADPVSPSEPGTARRFLLLHVEPQ